MPEVGKKPAPFRKLVAEIGGGGGVTVRLKVAGVTLATLATTVSGPAVEPAVTPMEACPFDWVTALDAESTPLPPVIENWIVTPAVAGATCTTSGAPNAAPTCAL